MKKIELAKQLLVKHPNLFRCPVCRQALVPNAGYSLVCRNGHSFDLAKTGSIHLRLSHDKPTHYSQALFEARQIISQSGFFTPLLQTIADLGEHFLQGKDERQIRILDAGCGEGSHLAHLVQTWQERRDVLGVGIDLSKEAIRLAAKAYPGRIWCVADVANLPLQSGQFAVILNLFSPTNYKEMKRLLRPDGLFIKVVPGSGYLQELRQLLFDQQEKRQYSNERIIARFRRQFQSVQLLPIRYTRRLMHDELDHLIRMSPLAWQRTDEDIQRAMASGLDSVTVDVVILMGMGCG